VVLYLNGDDYDGGATSFYAPVESGGGINEEGGRENSSVDGSGNDNTGSMAVEAVAAAAAAAAAPAGGESVGAAAAAAAAGAGVGAGDNAGLPLVGDCQSSITQPIRGAGAGVGARAGCGASRRGLTWAVGGGAAPLFRVVARVRGGTVKP
jgi:hypothetical protein